VSNLCDGAEAYRRIHNLVVNVYGMEVRMGDLVEGMITQLEDAEVQDMM